MKRFLRQVLDTILVKKSNLFDSSYYLYINPDVRRADIDPLNHYLKFGWKEGRNPSNFFDTNFYLQQNQDVKNSGMNPLVHYIRFGRNEGRKPNQNFFVSPVKPALEITRQADDQAVEIKASSIAPESTQNTLSASELANTIKENSRASKFVISLSHDNYLQVTVGGVQVYIANEQKKYNQENLSYIHFFPKESIEFLADDNQSFSAGINLDGKFLGTSEIQSIIKALNLLDSFELLDIQIHHTMGFNISFLNEILKLNNRQGNFWIHDYFSICPSYHLLRNGIEYCGAPDVRSNACTICKYGDQRKIQHTKFVDLFENNKFKFIAPSDYTIAFWQSKFPINNPNFQIRPPVQLRWLEKSGDKYHKGPVRVGFLGLPLPKKGWNTWLKLVNQISQTNKYEFFHFSSMAGDPGSYQRIHTQVTPKQPNSMIDNLIRHKIDVALLWSVVPETFSFTLHEALAAGCYIITNNLSGNIQDFVKKNTQYGLVLETEDELVDLLSSGNLVEFVKNFQRDGRPQAELIRYGDRRKN